MRKATEPKYDGSKKRLALNIIANAISYAIGIAVSFVLTPIVINGIGREAYAFYPMSTQITNAITLVTAALNTMASRFIAISLLKNKREDANQYFSSVLFVDSLISIVLAVGMTIFIVFIDRFLQIPFNLVASVRTLFIFTFSSAIVNIISAPFGVATFAKNRIDMRSWREIAAALLRLLLFVFFYSVLPPSLIYIGIITLGIALFNIVVQLIFTKRLLPEISLRRAYISKAHIKELLTSSLWAIINALGNTLLASLTLFFLNRFYGPNEASIVSLSLTIPGFMGGIVSTIVGVYYPLITKEVADESKDSLVALIKKVQAISGTIGCAIIAVFLPLSSSFFSLWVPTEDSNLLFICSAITLLPYLSTSCFWTATSVFTAKNKVKIPALATLIIGLLNLGTQLIFGLTGVPYLSLPLAAGILQIVWTGGFMPIYLSRITGERIAKYYATPLKIIMITAVVFGIVYAIAEFISINSWLIFILVGGGCGIAALVLYFSILCKKEVIHFLERIKR